MGARPHSRHLVDPFAALAAVGLVLGGCGSEEPLKPDEGVSPFFTGKPETPDVAPRAIRPVTNLSARSQEPAKAGALTSPSESEASENARKASAATGADPFSFEELDKLNKKAMTLLQKNAYPEAAKVFDQVLGAEPQNRMALFGRALVGMDLLESLSEQDRVAEIGRDADLARTMKRVHKPLQPRELAAIGILLFNEAAVLGTQGQADKCLEVLKEAVDDGFGKWEMMESSPALKSLQTDPRLQQLIKQVKETAVKNARVNVKYRIDSAVKFPFKFSLKDPDGKPLSSADLKGKVVLVDFWGTWCGPCRAAIPHLSEMHRKYSDQGLVIVGIACEQVSPEDAITLVKQAIDLAKIPYRCVMGNDEVVAQVPDFVGYPTTLILDGTGKVRFRSTGAQEGEAQAIENAAIVLLDDLKAQTEAAATPKKP